jgi:hypothetical protein
VKTSQNMAILLAKTIRNSVKELHGSTVPTPDVPDARATRRNALDTLAEVAGHFEQYAGAFEPEVSELPRMPL